MSYHWKCVPNLFASPFHQIVILLPAFHFWGKFLSHSYLLPNFCPPMKVCCKASHRRSEQFLFANPFHHFSWQPSLILVVVSLVQIMIMNHNMRMFLLIVSLSFIFLLSLSEGKTIVCSGAGETQYEVVSGRGIGLCLWVMCFSLSYSHNFHSHFQKGRMF